MFVKVSRSFLMWRTFSQCSLKMAMNMGFGAASSVSFGGVNKVFITARFPDRFRFLQPPIADWPAKLVLSCFAFFRALEPRPPSQQKMRGLWQRRFSFLELIHRY